jgi:hypothetical protein
MGSVLAGRGRLDVGYGRPEPDADLVGLGRAELGVEREGLLPVVAGLLVVSGAVVALGEVAVHARLLVGVAGLSGEPQGCRQPARAATGSPATCRASARLHSVRIWPL